MDGTIRKRQLLRNCPIKWTVIFLRKEIIWQEQTQKEEKIGESSQEQQQQQKKSTFDLKSCEAGKDSDRKGQKI